ncbi:hypothetical protein ACHQM5_014008 [Ranunculus cassubicifolius]
MNHNPSTCCRVNELRLLSELKQGYLKKELNECPQVMVLMAEIKEQKSVLKSYEIMGKKIESQLKLKDSEILFLKEKLEENRVSVEVLEKEVDPFGGKVLECVEFTELNSQHFVVFFRRCVESIRGFVKLLICNMSSNQWDLDAAAKTIEPGIVYGNENARYYASYVGSHSFRSLNPCLFLLETMIDKVRTKRLKLDGSWLSL